MSRLCKFCSANDEIKYLQDEIKRLLPFTRDEIAGALARGYCSKRNEHKVLDPDLIEDMVCELLKKKELLQKERTP